MRFVKSLYTFSDRYSWCRMFYRSLWIELCSLTLLVTYLIRWLRSFGLVYFRFIWILSVNNLMKTLWGEGLLNRNHSNYFQNLGSSISAADSNYLTHSFIYESSVYSLPPQYPSFLLHFLSVITILKNLPSNLISAYLFCPTFAMNLTK